MGKKKIILDTNIYVSALGYEGNEREVLRKCINGYLVLYLSEEILKELERVIEYPKFNFNQAQKDSFKLILSETGNLISVPQKSDFFLEDATDVKFLEAAVAAGADFLVTGDKHLLKIKRFGKTEILKAADFLRRFSADK